MQYGVRGVGQSSVGRGDAALVYTYSCGVLTATCRCGDSMATVTSLLLVDARRCSPQCRSQCDLHGADI